MFLFPFLGSKETLIVLQISKVLDKNVIAIKFVSYQVVSKNILIEWNIGQLRLIKFSCIWDLLSISMELQWFQGIFKNPI
jgi:hypothetical protein